MRFYQCLLLTGMVAAVLLWSNPSQAADGLRLVYSGGLRGEIKPCPT